jgi:FlaA1/EpsC-like NDP-sugar epimerase
LHDRARREGGNVLYKNHFWKKIVVCLLDILVLNGSYLVALWARFQLDAVEIPAMYLQSWLRFLPVATGILLLAFWMGRMYHYVWHLIGMNDLFRVATMSLLVNVLCVAGYVLLDLPLPRSCYLMGGLLAAAALTVMRYGCRIVDTVRRISPPGMPNGGVPTMLIGAGEAGRQLILENERNHTMKMDIRCVIDDNPQKLGSAIEGKRVVGGREKILSEVKKQQIQRIVFAIPAAGSETKKNILEICKQTECELKILPGIYQMVNNEVSLKALRDVSVEDLLGRTEVKVDNTQVFREITGKVVMVTGGGGSIGSELCRQLASHAPAMLLIVDIYENNAYEIQQELLRRYPALNLKVLIASVRDEVRIDKIFETYHPQVVFHAAAHKHVPLMEGSPNEAIKNNVFGTLNTGRAAIAHKAEKFILISTDKAVNPTNVMGASKRICEMIIQYLNRQSRDTDFAAVRFGNVLGSNGSVIPLFKEQIQEGGPVTVTHPDIIRYFMTIPEAVSLVLQAYAFARGGEIFVLDMGEPVKIVDLARNMIRLSGFEPDVDIKIVFTGLRPGEKLYEEMLMSEEGLRETENKLIHIGSPIPFDCRTFESQLSELKLACQGNSDEIREIVANVLESSVAGSGKRLLLGA